MRSARSALRMKSWPITKARLFQKRRRWLEKLRLARARDMRRDSSANTGTYRYIRARVVSITGGKRQRRSSCRISWKGVVQVSTNMARTHKLLLKSAETKIGL